MKVKPIPLLLAIALFTVSGSIAVVKAAPEGNPLEQIWEVIVVNEDPIDVNVTNQPEQESSDEAKTTKVIGSRFVHVSHGDLVNLPSGKIPVLYAEYEGSGTLDYLFARGQEDKLGVTITVDGVDVAQTDVYAMDILEGSSQWRLLRFVPNSSSQLEVVKKYHFDESLKIYLFNRSFDNDILGGAHAELTVKK